MRCLAHHARPRCVPGMSPRQACRTQLRRRTQQQVGSRAVQKMKIVSAPCTPSPQSARRLLVIQRTRRMSSSGLVRRRDWCRSRQRRLTFCVAMQQRKRADPRIDQDGVRVRTGVAAVANLALLGVSALSTRRPTPAMTLGTGIIQRCRAYFAHIHCGELDLGESAARRICRDSSMQSRCDAQTRVRAAVTILN